MEHIAQSLYQRLVRLTWSGYLSLLLLADLIDLRHVMSEAGSFGLIMKKVMNHLHFTTQTGNGDTEHLSIFGYCTSGYRITGFGHARDQGLVAERMMLVFGIDDTA